MSAGIRLRNTGNIAYTLSKMGIAVRHREQTWDETQGQLVKSFKTVATLVPSLGGGTSLAPGEATPVLQVEATGLNTDRVKELLRRPDSLYLEDEYFELENAEGLSYAFLKEINLARTARVLIDPGLGNAEEYRIATNVQRGKGGTYPGVTLGEILSDILGIDFATIGRKQVEPDSPSNERLLFRVRDLETNLTDPDLGYWAVVLQSENPPSGLYDFEEVPVKAGDRVLLVYVRDVDGDGVNDLLEQNSGTHDADGVDYDGDGLSDYEEVFEGWQVSWTDSTGEPHEYAVVSDPASADQDADGLNDLDEKTTGTDPSNPDTDRDGIPDCDDPAPLIQARVLYVDQNATGNNNGSSWADAYKGYTGLQAALSEARVGYNNNNGEAPNLNDDVAEIWVADGVYKPGPCDGQANPVYCSFKLVNTVGVYGGYRGIEEDHPGETKRSQRDRDPRTNATLLSGDLNGNDNVWPDDYADNICHIVQADGSITGRTAIDGFTIMGGNAPATQPFGGGMWIGGPGVVLKNIFFTDNHSSSGGGALRVSTDGATIRNCIFTENHAHPDDDGLGGAVYVDHYKDVSIEDCFFRGNTAGYRGGGIHAGWHTGVVINNSDFVENISGPATARWTQGGGAWVGDNSTLIINNSRFIGNETRERGGGVYVDQQSDVQVIQSLFRENKTVMDDASAYESGGGMCVATLSHTAIVNSTFIENETNANGSVEDTPGEGGGVFIGSPMKSFQVDNSIFWGNDSKHAPDDYISNQMYSSDGDFSKWLINTSCIQSYGSYSYWLRISGYGNTWEDPSLGVNGTPKSGSPVIDAGNTYVDVEPLNTGYQSLPEVDLAGKPRLVDGDTDGIADVDMGAYEYQP